MKKLLALSMVALVAGAPSVAIAQTPSEKTYKPDSQILGEVGEVEESAPAPAPEESGSAPEQSSQPTPAQTVPAQEQAGSLPFTGTDVLLLAVGGALLLGLGLSLRRFSRTIA